MVLFSNHMEERLQGGKSVLRVDCRMTRTEVDDDQYVSDEKKSLVPQGQVRCLCALATFNQFNLLYRNLQQDRA